MPDGLIRTTQGATVREYIVRDLLISMEADGAEYSLIDLSTELDVRGVRLVFDFETVFERTSGTAQNAAEFFLSLLDGTATTLHPDLTDNPSLSLSVVPDHKRPPPIFTREGRSLRRDQRFRLLSAVWYTPSDAALLAFAALMP